MENFDFEFGRKSKLYQPGENFVLEFNQIESKLFLTIPKSFSE